MGDPGNLSDTVWTEHITYWETQTQHPQTDDSAAEGVSVEAQPE